jgi:hypothetical protein
MPSRMRWRSPPGYSSARDASLIRPTWRTKNDDQRRPQRLAAPPELRLVLLAHVQFLTLQGNGLVLGAHCLSVDSYARRQFWLRGLCSTSFQHRMIPAKPATLRHARLRFVLPVQDTSKCVVHDILSLFIVPAARGIPCALRSPDFVAPSASCDVKPEACSSNVVPSDPGSRGWVTPSLPSHACEEVHQGGGMVSVMA